jgi:hypothetical protein
MDTRFLRPTRPVTKVILGCLECKPTLPLADVDKLERNRGKRGIGWHFLIFPDRIEQGRSLDLPGNHTVGYNADSIGIGIVGGLNGLRRLGCHYEDGQVQRAIEFAREYASKLTLPAFYQHQLIETKNPYFGDILL